MKSRSNNIFLVPSHADLPQNEMADYLAKAKVRHASISVLNPSLTMIKAFKAIKDMTMCKKNRRWFLKRNNSEYKIYSLSIGSKNGDYG